MTSVTEQLDKERQAARARRRDELSKLALEGQRNAAVAETQREIQTIRVRLQFLEAYVDEARELRARLKKLEA